MNHGFKINGNILEITLPEEVHIDKVIVNRQIFSQRQRVCESCKYHEKEGHEEPCVSCEVGNSNYVPSVGLEERTEECTETHACDCISRQAAIEALRRKAWSKQNIRKGDEVIYNSRTKAIVLTPETKERYGTILTSEFDTIVVSHDDLEKTGRHFSDIEELLKKMRGEE